MHIYNILQKQGMFQGTSNPEKKKKVTSPFTSTYKQ